MLVHSNKDCHVGRVAALGLQNLRNFETSFAISRVGLFPRLLPHSSHSLNMSICGSSCRRGRNLVCLFWRWWGKDPDAQPHQTRRVSVGEACGVPLLPLAKRLSIVTWPCRFLPITFGACGLQGTILGSFYKLMSSPMISLWYASKWFQSVFRTLALHPSTEQTLGALSGPQCCLPLAGVGICGSDFNSLHAEVIYTFQFRNAEIARNQHCQSDSQSWQAC